MSDGPSRIELREDYLDQRREYLEWEKDALPAWEEKHRPGWEDQRRDVVADELEQDFQNRLPDLVREVLETEWEIERERAWEAVREELYEDYLEREHES